MQRIYFFLFGFIVFTAVTMAQETCKLRGEIRDSIGFPVYDASISAFNSKNEGVAFTFSDMEGLFEMEVPCGEKYDVEIEHVEYDSHSQNVNMDKTKSLKFKLKKSSISLQEAVIQAKKPITVKGDTIEYDANSFRTNADENLEDLLRKLPGLQVENGKVFYEGKEITTIKVGNREVLGGNTKLLTKNLPADAIDKIQLNKKFKANPFSNSLSDDEEAMLNIELREDKKSLLFGNVTLGGDADEHADGQTKLFYFSPKTDGTFIADYNTYGKEVFTNEDYVAFFGGFSELMEDGSSFSLRDSQSGIMLGSAQDAADMSALLGAVHFGYEPNKKLYTNGFVLFNKNNLRFKSTEERISEGLTFRDEQKNDQDLLSTIGRFRLDYSPDSRSQIKYRLNFNYLENESEQLADRFLNDNSLGGTKFLQNKIGFGLKQNISYIRKIGKDHNLGIYVRHQMTQDDPELQINSSLVPIVIDSMAFNDLRQDRTLNTQNLQVYGIYNHLLTNTSNLRLKMGSNFSWQNLENSIFEANSLITAENFRTDSDLNFSELYADLTYTKKFGAFKFDLGVGLHNFASEANLIDDSRSRNLTKLLPHFKMDANIKNAQNIYLEYKQEYKLPNLVNLSDGYEVQNYYSVYRGFLDLKESLYHNLSLRYGYYNSFSFLHYYAGATYIRSIDNMQISSELVPPTQFNSVMNNPEDDQNLIVYFGGGKRFNRFYSLNLNANLSYMDYFTQIGRRDSLGGVLVQDRVNNISFTQNYTLTNKFKFKKKVELDVGLQYLNSNFKSVTDMDFVTWRPFAKAAWSISEKFLLQSDYAYRIQYQNEELINENQALNASLRFHVAKSTYLTFIAGNILGNDKLVSSSFDANFNQTIVNTRELLGRYFLLQLRYKF
jgi:hypothetical protein